MSFNPDPSQETRSLQLPLSSVNNANVSLITGICQTAVDYGEFVYDQTLDRYLYESLESTFFFYLGFLSRTFTIHRTAGELSTTSTRFTDTQTLAGRLLQ